MLWGCETHNTGTECFCCGIYIKHVCAHWFTGLTVSCFQTLWLKRLRRKFHNNRKRKESALDVVIANQQRFGKSSKEEANEHKGTQKSGSGEMFGMANYLPSAPASEDQESTKQHISWLRSTARVRREEDAPKGKKLMDLTLHDRRRRVILDGERPAAILEDYPWLGKSPSSVFDEIHRISGVNVEKCTTSFLNDYGNAILMACKGHQFHVIDGADRKDKYAASTAAFMGGLPSLEGRPEIFLRVGDPRACIDPCLHSIWGTRWQVPRLHGIPRLCWRARVGVMWRPDWSCRSLR